MSKALGDVRILEYTTGVDGPTCGMTLALMGAEVIKVESLKGVPGGVRTGKKSVKLNLETDKGREIFKKLAEVSDVVLENYLPGTMGQLGLGYEDLKKVNSKIIFGSITPYGQTGPDKDRIGPDLNILARCGIMYQISKKGFEEHPTTGDPKIFLADRMASLQMTVAILAALHHREITGRGQWIDIAKLDTIVRNLVDGGYNNYLRDGKWEIRERKYSGIGVPGYDLYKCKDRYVMLAILGQRIQSKFLKVVGREDLIPLFMKERNIVQRRPDIKEEYEKIIDDFVSTRPREEVVKILRDAGVPADPANTVPEAVYDPQLRSRGMFVKAYHPGLKREVETLAAPVKMSETPGVLENPFPLLGGATEEVLTTLLGYTEEEVTALEKKGVLT